MPWSSGRSLIPPSPSCAAHEHGDAAAAVAAVPSATAAHAAGSATSGDRVTRSAAVPTSSPSVAPAHPTTDGRRSAAADQYDPAHGRCHEEPSVADHAQPSSARRPGRRRPRSRTPCGHAARTAPSRGGCWPWWPTPARRRRPRRPPPARTSRACPTGGAGGPTDGSAAAPAVPRDARRRRDGDAISSGCGPPNARAARGRRPPTRRPARGRPRRRWGHRCGPWWRPPRAAPGPRGCCGSRRRGSAAPRRPAGHDVLDDGIEGGGLVVVVGDGLGRPEDHHRAVVHRVVERAAGEHEAVEERDGHAHRRALAGGTEPRGGRRPVDEELITTAGVGGGDRRPARGRWRARRGRAGPRRGSPRPPNDRRCPARGCVRWWSVRCGGRAGARRSRVGSQGDGRSGSHAGFNRPACARCRSPPRPRRPPR